MITSLMIAQLIGQLNFGTQVAIGAGVIIAVFVLGFIALIIKCWNKVAQGKALVRNGWGGTKVFFDGGMIYPVVHKAEWMDISVKRIEIDRSGEDGLICKDNIRADIKVVFLHTSDIHSRLVPYNMDVMLTDKLPCVTAAGLTRT